MDRSIATDRLLSQRSGSGREVFPSVIGAIRDSQIFKSVVSAVPVDVVDDLVGKQRTAQMLFDDPAMFVNVASFGKRSHVISAFRQAAKIVVAIARTKLASTKPAPANAEMFAALDALQNNLVFYLTYQAFGGKFGVGIDREGDSFAGVGTKPITTSDLSSMGSKEDATAFALHVHKRHSTTDQSTLQSPAQICRGTHERPVRQIRP